MINSFLSRKNEHSEKKIIKTGDGTTSHNHNFARIEFSMVKKVKYKRQNPEGVGRERSRLHSTGIIM